MANKLVLAASAAAMCFAGTANAQDALTWVTNVPGTWINTAANGLNLSDDGEVNINTTVGNAVFSAGTVRVGSNGAVGWNAGTSGLSFVNQAIPSTSMFSGAQSLAPFWDDINTSNGTNGNIFWEEIGGTLVISWDAVGFFASADHATFQLQIHSSGPLAQLLYRDVGQARPANGASATIGYQDGTAGFGDAQWSFNTASVQNGMVLTLIPAPGAAVLLGLGGLVATRRRRG